MQKSKLRNENRKFNSGFTLIEVLIVVVIIGVLATLLMVNFIGVRQRARDAQRKSDLRQIQSALELYRADFGSYPNALKNCGVRLGSDDCNTIYMQNVPKDPLSSAGDFTYDIFGAPASYYCIRACLENSSDQESDIASGRTISSDCPITDDCPSGNEYNFTVQTP